MARIYQIEQNRELRESCAADLQAVCTLSEAVLVYGKTVKAIQTQVDKGRIEYRKSGKTTLLSVESLDLLWPRRPEFEGGF